MRRAAVYTFFDPHGEVGDYIPFKLKALREHVELLVVVCNGAVSDTGLARLKDVADVVHCRGNDGFDIWGFRTGLCDVIGWEALADYDEVLLLNSTFYAPIFPFAELFSSMQKRDVDLWGITAFNGPVPNGFTGKGMLPYHIQSYFMGIRRSLHTAPAFRAYWDELPPLVTYVDAVLKHEVCFTERFAQLGFRHAVYCDASRYRVNNASFDAIDLLMRDRCPVLKRRPFFHDPLYLEINNVELRRALDIVAQESTYDVSLIWSDITRSAPPLNLYVNTTLLEVPAEPRVAKPTTRIAACVHVSDPTRLPEALTHLEAFPQRSDVFFTTDAAWKQRRIERIVRDWKRPVQAVRCSVESPGPTPAFFVGLRDVIERYDYVARLHATDNLHLPVRQRRAVHTHLFENLFADAQHIERLLALFDSEPHLGLLMPPHLHIAQDDHLMHGELVRDIDTRDLAKELGIHVPLDEGVPLLALGSMYWVRPAALATLLQRSWRWSDFDRTTLSSSLDLLTPAAVQQAGFYSKCVLTPAQFANNYVKAEFRLQKMVGYRAQHQNVIGFPSRQLRGFLRDTMALRSPGAFKMTRAVLRAARRAYRLGRRS